MDAIKNFPKIFYKKISLPAEKSFSSNFLKLITSNIILLILFANLLLLTACEDEVIQPPPKQPGFQEDIPWPSLANSPWPIEHSDPQNTGRSKYIGPKIGMIENIIDSVNSNTGIVIGPDSMIYYACQNELKAFSKTGQLKWKIPFGVETLGTPIVGNDGTIYVLYSYVLAAINSDGTKKWEIPVSALNSGGFNIGLDGTLYFADSGDHTVYAFDKQGNKLWSLMDNRIMGWNPPIISPDSKTIYLPGYGVTLIAIDIESQSVKWAFGTIDCFPAPVIDCNGNIYINSNLPIINNNKPNVFSLEHTGKVRWSFLHGESVINAMTLDKNGNLIFGGDSLFSINYSGTLNWKLPMQDFISPRAMCCDADGNIYTIIAKNFSSDFILQCYNNVGNLNFEILNGLTGWAPNYSPALFFNKLIIPTQESNISYIIQ